MDRHCSKKLSFGGSNWFEKTNTTELHIVLRAVRLSVVKNIETAQTVISSVDFKGISTGFTELEVMDKFTLVYDLYQT